MSVVARAALRLLAANERRLDRKVPKADGPLDPRAFTWTAEVHARWDELKAECDALVARRVALPQVNDLVGTDQGAEGSWANMVLFSYGTWVEPNVARCPRTTELVRDIPGLTIAGYTVLGARSHLPRHRGPNRGALRYQIGLRVPEPAGSCRIDIGSATHVWTEGGEMLFDDSVEHEAWNDSDADRYVMFIEFVWPVPGLTGLLNRGTQALFGVAARSFPKRAIEIDAALNPPI